MTDAGELQRAVDRTDASLRDLLNLMLNVTKDGGSGFKGAQVVETQDEPGPSENHREASGSDSSAARSQEATGGSKRNDKNEKNELPDQQKRLVDSVLINCKRLENFFLNMESESGKARVRKEIALLESEIAEKDRLLDSVTKDLSRWIQNEAE